MERKVLKASAGTGKTYRLSLEYAVSLFNGEKIKDIVIMTFTKKAAGEIKEDIIKFIKKLAFVPRNEKEEKDRVGAVSSIMKIYPDKFSSEREIFEKAGRAYREIILNKDSLKIFTIDGLKNLIFKTAIAPMLNINSYEMLDDSENTEYLKRCFERIFKNKKDFDILKNFLEDNLERDMENYVKVIGNIIEERWKNLLISKKEREFYNLKGSLNHIDRYIKVLEKIFEKKRKGEETIKDFIKKDFHSYLDKTTQEEKEKYILDNWSSFFDGELKNGIKTKSTKKIDVEEENEELAEIYEEFLQELSKRIYNDTLISYEKEVLSFLEKVYSVYDEIKFREKKFTHTDITNYTLEYINDKRLNLIDENGKITDYMKDILESSITTVFIDEFQDTSVVQWKIFKSMVESAEKVICVGDEKQSIYEWRGGEKGLFENLSKIMGSEEETMGVSYRSKKEIVDFTNEFFKNYSELAKLEGINWNFEPVESSDKDDKGYAAIYKVEKDVENYCEKIADILEEKFKGDYRDICIIARNNDTLTEIGGYLAERHIPYFLETNLSVFSHRTTEPLVKFMKYLVSDNKFYLAEFLRDNLILISDRSLKEFLSFKGKIEEFSFSDEKLNKILEKILYFKEKYNENRYENIDILTEIIKEFGISVMYKNESDMQNIYDFINISKKFLNVDEFLNEIKENGDSSEYKQSSLEAKNGVSLMTIHKSKGLGYETVFYVHQKKSHQIKHKMEFNISMSENYDTVEDYFIMNSKFEKILKYLDGQFDYEEHKKMKRDEEEINNLYVAFTRSKNNFFMIINEKTPKTPSKNPSIFKRIIDEKFFSENCTGYSRGHFEISEKEERDKVLIETENEKFLDFEIDFSKYDYNEEKFNENKLKLIEEEFKYSTEREEKRETGNIVHYFLENLIYNEDEEREKAEKTAVIKYGASFGRENVLNILESTGVKNFLLENSEIFSKDWDFIYPEYSIYSETENKLYRLDRVMIKKSSGNKKGKVLVVDYKTGGFEESQLENYLSLIEQELKRINEFENYEIEGRYLQIEI